MVIISTRYYLIQSTPNEVDQLKTHMELGEYETMYEFYEIRNELGDYPTIELLAKLEEIGTCILNDKENYLVDIGKMGLIEIIKDLENSITEIYKDLESCTDIKKFQRRAKSMRFSWEDGLSLNLTNPYHLSYSEYLEYDIFNFLMTLKTFDFEKYKLLIIQR